ncbi:protein ALP1-like isoform X1 [Lactuca sativa]|uniref:protein ALP1-like isoform X1 n=1 Tax=Lactuca sativa TaxID=4236 RepID=UPI000CD9D1E3|nr:protein ALP1-like isoform X1 [Lactuca sativa]
MLCPERKQYMQRLVYESDETCTQQLRMNRITFVKLCRMVEIDGKLKASRYLQVDEQVAIFLYVLAHHVKNRVAKFQFRRSGETISKHFNNVLNVVIRLEKELFKKPEPISETSTDERWKWFKGCLGAIDGTHISVHVSEADKPRHRNRKGEITMNVLAACTPDMQFIYVLPGWEGSAADGRILRSAMLQENGLQVSKGNYYLVDVGYTNGERFLARFRGQRYHLNTWLNGHRPKKAEEYFNMKHSAARNVIERCFGVLKKMGYT